MLSVGLDVGATNVLAAIVDADGEVLASATARTPRGDPADLARVLVSTVREVCGARAPDRLGMAVAGRVTPAGTRQAVASARVDWGGGSVVDDVEKALGIKVRLLNDGEAAAWGELLAGSARALSDFLLLTVGTGLGGGLVLGARPYSGAHGASAEVGHITLVSSGGRECPCGKFGCWEQYASGTALALEAAELAASRPDAAAWLDGMTGGDPARLTGTLVAEGARAGDPLALDAFDRVAAALANGILEVNELLDLQAVVIGGGLAEAADLLLPSARAHLDALAERRRRRAPELLTSRLGSRAGVVGAALLPPLKGTS